MAEILSSWKKKQFVLFVHQIYFQVPIWAGHFSMYWRCNSEQDKTLPCSFGALQTVMGVGNVGRGKEGNNE